MQYLICSGRCNTCFLDKIVDKKAILTNGDSAISALSLLTTAIEQEAERAFLCIGQLSGHSRSGSLLFSVQAWHSSKTDFAISAYRRFWRNPRRLTGGVWGSSRRLEGCSVVSGSSTIIKLQGSDTSAIGAWQYFLFVKFMPRMCGGVEAFVAKPLSKKVKDAAGLRTLALQIFVDMGISNPLLYFPMFYAIKEKLEVPHAIWCLFLLRVIKFVREGHSMME
jgi:hypothetical protein